MGASTVSFHNSYSTTLFVAYLREDHGCGDECGQPWDVLGWVKLVPGATGYRANPTNNRYFYYYAEALNGAIWRGPAVAEVSNSAFEKCTCIGVREVNGGSINPYHDVGFRELDTDVHGGVNFIP